MNLTNRKLISDKLALFLDIFRGVCVLLVAIGHFRSFLFVNSSDLSNDGLTNSLFYFFTSLGHYAVIIFFVISGFLCGGTYLVRTKQFNFWQYIINRVSRVYALLIPVLFISSLVDMIGITNGLGVYFGDVNDIYSISYNVYDSYNLKTFLSTLLLLNGHESIWGSNTPLWSLSYELYFYIFFAVCFDLKSSNKKAISIIFIVVFTSLMAINFNVQFFFYFILWLLGIVPALIINKLNESGVRKMKFPYLLPLYFVILCSIFALFKVFKLDSILRDVIIASYFALGIVLFRYYQLKINVLFLTFQNIGKISFSIYIVHFPIGLLISSLFKLNFNNGEKIQPSLEGYFIFSIMIAVTYSFSYFIFNCFEMKHVNLRYYLKEKMTINYENK